MVWQLSIMTEKDWQREWGIWSHPICNQKAGDKCCSLDGFLLHVWFGIQVHEKFAFRAGLSSPLDILACTDVASSVISNPDKWTSLGIWQVRTHHYLPDRKGWCHFLPVQNVLRRPAMWLTGARTTWQQGSWNSAEVGGSGSKLHGLCLGAQRQETSHWLCLCLELVTMGYKCKVKQKGWCYLTICVCTKGRYRSCSYLQSPCNSNEML